MPPIAFLNQVRTIPVDRTCLQRHEGGSDEGSLSSLQDEVVRGGVKRRRKTGWCRVLDFVRLHCGGVCADERKRSSWSKGSLGFKKNSV